jgi:hypothetical protein
MKLGEMHSGFDIEKKLRISLVGRFFLENKIIFYRNMKNKYQEINKRAKQILLNSHYNKTNIYHHFEDYFKKIEKSDLLETFGIDKLEEFDITKTIENFYFPDIHIKMDNNEIIICVDYEITIPFYYVRLRIEMDDKLNIIGFVELHGCIYPNYDNDELIDRGIKMIINRNEEYKKTRPPFVEDLSLETAVSGCFDIMSKYHEINEKTRMAISKNFNTEKSIYDYFEGYFETLGKETAINTFGTDNFLEVTISEVVDNMEFPDLELVIGEDNNIIIFVDYYISKRYFSGEDHIEILRVKMDEKLNILSIFTIGKPYKWDYTHILSKDE